MTRISVLMGIYNCASTLVEALDSLYAQTYQDFKIILCEDGSSDDTYAVAEKYAQSHDNIILLRNESNMGLNYTLNRCLEHADTEFIARMDGDDISLPERFEREINFLDAHPEYALVSCSMVHFDENGDYITDKGIGEIKKVDFIHGSPINHAPCMIKTIALKTVGGYTVDDKLLRVEDYHLWFKLFAAGYKLYMLNEPLYKMRDDKNAYKRRTFKNRLNEAYVRHIGYKMIHLPWYVQVFALRPILVHLIPDFVYKWYHQNNN
ncbi:MAG: glycosyltransferase [Muribaculaceae bacterium]|nr:glycosyltransferase [Muribaculaceae bacterium]